MILPQNHYIAEVKLANSPCRRIDHHGQMEKCGISIPQPVPNNEQKKPA